MVDTSWIAQINRVKPTRLVLNAATKYDAHTLYKQYVVQTSSWGWAHIPHLLNAAWSTLKTTYFFQMESSLHTLWVMGHTPHDLKAYTAKLCSINFKGPAPQQFNVSKVWSKQDGHITSGKPNWTLCKWNSVVIKVECTWWFMMARRQSMPTWTSSMASPKLSFECELFIFIVCLADAEAGYEFRLLGIEALKELSPSATVFSCSVLER